MREKGQTEVAKTLETPVFSRGIEILTEKSEFPISDVAEDVAEPYRSVAQSKGKNYTLDIQEGLSYCGDEKAIRELIAALLDNAFKYSSDGGSILASLAAEGKGIRFTVENTVTGIGPKQLEFFTQRFYRNDTSDKIKGFGIGLSLAQVNSIQRKIAFFVSTKPLPFHQKLPRWDKHQTAHHGYPGKPYRSGRHRHAGADSSWDLEAASTSPGVVPRQNAASADSEPPKHHTAAARVSAPSVFFQGSLRRLNSGASAAA